MNLLRSSAAPLAAALGFALLLPGAAGAATASFEIRAYLPLTCQADITSYDVASAETLTIDAVVHQSCNASNQLSVRYDGAAVANPAGLSITYAGRPPVARSSGEATFAQDRYINALRPLRITYAGGSEADRQRLAATVTVDVTPL